MLMPDIHNTHVGETAWVMGSGSTLNFIERSFFDDKLVVSTNMASFDFGITPAFAFTHHHSYLRDHAPKNPSTIFVANQFDYPSRDEWVNPPSNVIIHKPKTEKNSHAQFNPFEQDKPAHAHQLVFGSSSGHGAMHLAAYLGVRNIVLVGIDCGVIDGQTNFDDYSVRSPYPFEVWNRHLVLMRNWLRDTYNVNVYSLNPFVNLHLEGHTFN